MRKYFHALYLDWEEDETERRKENIVDKEEQKRFVAFFSYESPLNPVAEIDDILHGITTL
jgi:hypothetical protein